VELLLIILNVTENMPDWVVWLTGIGGILAIIGGIFKNLDNILTFFKTLFGLFKSSSKSGNRKYKKLHKHILFKKIDETLQFDKIETTSTTRSEIALLLKDIKLKKYKEKILELLNEDLKKMKREELVSKSKDILFEYVEESNKLFKKQSNNKEEEKTADLIIQKFNKYESEQIRTAISVIDDINNDKELKKNLDVIDNILTAYQFLVNNIITTTKETILRINGELNGKEFLGKEIENSNGRI
jgi:hypothetical protein